LEQIPPIPPGLELNFYGEHLGSDFDDHMGENHNIIPPWMSRGDLKLAGTMQELPKHPGGLLLKFDTDKSCSCKDHVKNLFLATRLLEVNYKYVVCRIFPYTFEKNASTRYFNLSTYSITNWNNFEKSFNRKFGDENTPISLFKELVALNMGKKENIKDFNQCFTTILHKFTIETTPLEPLIVEYYTSTFLPSIGMLVKSANKTTLAQNFEEFKEVERELFSLGNHSASKETKVDGKKPLLLSKPFEKDPKDIDSVVKLVK
jgi:hypothetical protein